MLQNLIKFESPNVIAGSTAVASLYCLLALSPDLHPGFVFIFLLSVSFLTASPLFKSTSPWALFAIIPVSLGLVFAILTTTVIISIQVQTPFNDEASVYLSFVVATASIAGSIAFIIFTTANLWRATCEAYPTIRGFRTESLSPEHTGTLMGALILTAALLMNM